MSVGTRDRLVTIQQLTETRSSAGFPVESWTTLATAYMTRRDASGRERFSADQVSASLDVTWTLYYRPDMDPETVDVPKRRRLVSQGRVYDITRAVPVGFHQDIELTTLASSKVPS